MIHPIVKLLGYQSNEDFYNDFPTKRHYENYIKNGSKIKKKAANGTQVTENDPGGQGTQGAMQLDNAPQTAESMTQQGQQSQQQMGTAYNPATDPYNPVNQTAPVNTPVANNNSNNSGNRFKFNPKFNSQKGGISTNGILAGGIQLFDSLLPYQKPKQNQNLYQQALQTNPYGTGSVATFADGGMIPAGNSGLAVEDGKYKQLSDNTIQLEGNSHKNHGTDIEYNRTRVEAEAGETVHISPIDNSAIVGGNMYIPGSNTKYKKAFKEIGKVEGKQQKVKNQADYFTTDFDPSVKASAPTHNTGLVLQDAHVQHSAAIDTIKQQLTDMQNIQLKIMEKTGKKPEEVHKYLSGVAKYGKTIKADNGTSIDENPKIPGVNYFGDSPNPNIKYNGYDNSQDPNTITEAPGAQPNYTTNVPENANLAVPISNDNVSNPIPTNSEYTPPKSNISGPIKGLRNKFRVLDYLPEISTLFDKPQPVQSVQETPLMESEYNISLQGKKNSIISSFKPALDATRNNPAQQAAISAQMAEQLAAVDGEEVNYNQQNAAGIRGRNLQELRNVRDINLRADEDQLNKRSQAISNTKADQFRALESISDREAKRRYSNNQLGLEENYFGWKYNPDNKDQMWQRTLPDGTIQYSAVPTGLEDKGATTTKKRTKSDNSGNTENSYEEDTKTAYLGGKIASRKSSSKEPSKGKKKLKYT